MAVLSQDLSGGMSGSVFVRRADGKVVEVDFFSDVKKVDDNSQAPALPDNVIIFPKRPQGI